MASALQALTKGEFANKWNYDNPFSPSSPWSLILAFMPETVAPSFYVRELDNQPLEQTSAEELDPEIAEFVSKKLQLLNWFGNDTDRAAIAHRFQVTRLRQIDAACGSIQWDSGSKFVGSDWYKGIIRPLTLLRDSYKSQLSLAEFEALSPEDAFAAMMAPATTANISHITSYIAGPYCEYKKRPELLQKHASSMPLESALKVSSNQLLSKDIVSNCYNAPLNLPVLREISARVGNETLKHDISAASILRPERLQDIRDIRDGSPDLQFNTLAKFIAQYPPEFSGVWDSLDALKPVCPSVDMERLRPLVLQEAMKRGKFSLIRQQHNRWPALLVQNSAVEFIERTKLKLISKEAPPAAIQDVIGACRLINDTTLTDQFVAAQALNARYNVSMDVVLNGEPQALLEKILELNPRAYQQKNVINQVSQATGKQLDQEFAYGQFVEFALVDNNFKAAVEFCDLMDPRSENAWVGYLQTTKFVSSLWDQTPPKILAKKQELIVKCIELCPAQDLATVLTVYERLENEAEASSQRALTPVSSGPGDMPQRVNPKPRKRVQNLLVSGIGWAIGAPAHDSD